MTGVQTCALPISGSATLAVGPAPAHPAAARSDAVEAQAELASAAPAREVTIMYRTHDGHRRNAYVLLPAGYEPGNASPIPLVISPHGRAVDGKINTRRWTNLPTLGGFAVISPDGYGRVLPLHSWGAPGQIDDLARMPEIGRASCRERVFAVV